jgi:hypothetical protein
MADRRSACFGPWLSRMRVAGTVKIPTGKESPARWIHLSGGHAERRDRPPVDDKGENLNISNAAA